MNNVLIIRCADLLNRAEIFGRAEYRMQPLSMHDFNVSYLKQDISSPY